MPDPILELGDIDDRWGVSITWGKKAMKITASNLPKGTGWYIAFISREGAKITMERVMNSEGNYDPFPENNRPDMHRILAAIPSYALPGIITLLKEAYAL